MKLLFLTDTHIRGNTPKNRKDNLPETIERKFHEVLKIVEEHNIDFVLHGGDLFDRPDVSVSIVADFASILNDIKIPIFSVCGNHDVYGHNPDTLNRTMLGLLNSLNILNVVNEDEIKYLKKDNITVQLTGRPYTYNIDDDLNKSNYIVRNVPDNIDYSIHMVHGMLLDKPFIKGIPYTLIDDIKETEADITLSGHYHTGFGLINIDDKYFVNPGSLIRITNSLAEIDRRPKVAIVELDKSINIQFIELETAKKGRDILDRKEIEDHIFKMEQLFEFKQSIDTAINFDKLEINDILLEVSNTENVSKKVKEEALRRITLSQMRELGDDV